MPAGRESAQGTGTGRGSGRQPLARRAVAILTSRFPVVTETFILRELLELERRGQPVLLVPLLRQRTPVVHREARPWTEKALYTPFLSPAILAANARQILRRPGRCLRLLRRLLIGRGRSPGYLVRTLVFFPKAVYLAQRLEREGITHLHAHFATHPATVAYVIASLTDITYSITVHAHDIFVSRDFLEEKLAAAVWVRTISEFNRRFLLDRYPELPAEKLRVLHVGVPPATVPARPAATLGDPPRLLCIAALRPYKGIPVLIRACARLRDRGRSFRCTVVGDGPLRRRLGREIAERGLADTVRLVGALPQDEVAGRIASASVVVQPSVTADDGQMEGIPVALMEALAAGKPVVASALSGIPELIENGVEGVLVEPGEVDELAAAIEGLLADPERAETLGRQGRQKVASEFCLSRTVAALLELLDGSNSPVDPELARCLGDIDWPDGQEMPIGVRGVRERRDSRVGEILLAAGGRPREAILKVQRSFPGESRPAAVRAREEFEGLLRLHRWFGNGRPGVAPRTGGDGRCGVPRPLYLIPDSAALVLARCRGQSLEGLVRRQRFRWPGAESRDLRTGVRQAGVWLCRFQGLELFAVNGASALQRLHDRARADLEQIAEQLPSRRARQLRHLLERLAATTASSGVAAVPRHGDFWPGNVYVHPEGVEVIDFEGMGAGLPYEDPAYFLVHLELYLAYPLMGRQREALSAAFLDGYLDGSALDRPLWELCRAAAVLRVLRHRHSPTPATGLDRWRRRRVLARVTAA